MAEEWRPPNRSQEVGASRVLQKGYELLAEFRVEGVLGQGGFGVTYEARDLLIAKRVAIKEYFPSEFAARDEQQAVHPKTPDMTALFEWGRDSFLQEARTLACFNHPNIVQVTTVFEAMGTAYLVLEYVEGKSLEAWLAALGRPPQQDELDRLTDGLLDALRTIHANGYIHRDIAPDNIIVRPDGTPVLLDFGAARQALAERTHTLTSIVKPGYSPPEQYAVSTNRQGPWTDIYALAATLYFAVAGERPLAAPDRQLEDSLPSVATRARTTYRPAFLAALDKGLQLKAADRPQTVEALIAASHATDGAAVAAPSMLAGGGGTRAVQGRRTVLMASALGGLVAVGMAAYLLFVPGRNTQLGPGASVALRVGSAGREQVRWLVPGNGRQEWFKDCEGCPEMVVVPPGRYLMGSPPGEAGHSANEAPQHPVTISKPFAVSRFEVTFEEWQACVAEEACELSDADPSWRRAGHPVVYVSWDDAKAYVAWLSRKTGQSYRLLTEAEWEYVARAGTTTPFWWGTSVTSAQANFDGTGTGAAGGKGLYRRRTLPVASFAPNPWGLYNVHGNIWEWVEDCWTPGYGGSPADGAPRTSGDCLVRVTRGGSWLSDPSNLRAADRVWNRSDLRAAYIGIRVARTLEP
ncbi:MAG: bifunctional serine/threonine-protein kinase/formylglycine-generating enzyme family protein [Hyphomicrobiaceae bacterium]